MATYHLFKRLQFPFSEKDRLNAVTQYAAEEDGSVLFSTISLEGLIKLVADHHRTISQKGGTFFYEMTIVNDRLEKYDAPQNFYEGPLSAEEFTTFCQELYPQLWRSMAPPSATHSSLQ